MKKLFAIMSAVLALAACSKGELAEIEEQKQDNAASNPVTFNITVDDMGTKALKTGWADGDVIYIKFSGINDKYVYITYNGSSWDVTQSTPFNASDFDGKTKRFGAVHFPVPVNATLEGTVISLVFKDDAGKSLQTYFLYQSNGSYTVSGAEVNLRLSLQKHSKMALFHVAGIQASASEYTLAVSGNPTLTAIYPPYCGRIGNTGSVIPDHMTNKFGPVPGVADSDGAVFAVWLEEGFDSSTPRDLTFTLTHSSGAQYVISGSKTIAAGKQYGLPALNSGKWTLKKVFSVSPTKKVCFAPGNLQATTTDLGASWTWDFAAHQYDFIGNAAANTQIDGVGTVSQNGTVDLFGYVGASAAAENDCYGINMSKESKDYGNGFADNLKHDWGTLAIGSYPAGTWRSLLVDEVNYLLTSRTVSSTNLPDGTNSSAARFTKATVCGVKGLILFPDNYAHPDGITVTGSYRDYNAAAEYNSFEVAADADWNKMADAGAVFLPAAGYRDGIHVRETGIQGAYWTKSGYSNYSQSYFIYFTGTYCESTAFNRFYGCAVRLVRDL